MKNINEFNRLYRRKKHGLGVTGSLVRISTLPLAAKMLRTLTHATAENLTNSTTKIRFGISNRGIDFYLDELQTVAANELVVSHSDTLLGDGDRFFAEFTGTTDDDELILVLSGWEREL